MLIMLSILLVGAVDWAEILRDAQATNRANVRQGVATVTSVYSPPRSLNDRDVMIRAEIAWRDDDLFEKYQFQSFGEFPLGRKEEGPIASSPWDHYLRNSTEAVVTNGRYKVVGINAIDQDAMDAVIDFHPWSAWMKCCPPRARQGRPWSAMLEYRATGEDGSKSTLTFDRINDDEIKQTRRDPNGFVAETIFSLSQGGNVLRFESFPPPGIRQKTIGTYKWKRLGPAFVLDSCDFRKDGLPRLEDQFEVYRLKVESIDLRPVEPEVFTRAHVLDLMPPGDLQIMDSISKRYGRVAGKPGVDDGELKSLSEKVRARGYAKPD